jgi:hypothetical protein
VKTGNNNFLLGLCNIFKWLKSYFSSTVNKLFIDAKRCLKEQDEKGEKE